MTDLEATMREFSLKCRQGRDSGTLESNHIVLALQAPDDEKFQEAINGVISRLTEEAGTGDDQALDPQGQDGVVDGPGGRQTSAVSG